MSLKAFHIAFIAASVLLAIGYGVWEIGAYTSGGSFAHLSLGVLAFLAAVGLVVYGRRFLRKLKHVSMI